MRVAAVQHDIIWEEPSQNFTHLAPTVALAAAGGADLVLLTEMFATGFSMATERIAEPADGPTVQWLREQADAHSVWVGGSLPELGAPGTLAHNQFVLAGPDGSLHRYAKIHPFSYAGEHEHYAAGTATITVDIAGVRVTPLVCYDLRFADTFWKVADNTDAYVIVANWPAARRQHWQTLLRARAIENQAYVVGVNRVGSGGGVDYCGDSVIVDPFGEIVAEAGAPETVLCANLDASRVRAVRAEYPFLADRV